MITLTAEQTQALNLMKQGNNIFLTGPAGTGKSTVIKHFKRYADQNHQKTEVCSTTGISALIIGGTTLHSWAGIKLGTETATHYISEIKKNKWDLIKWQTIKTLIIDEVSMLDPEYLRKLEKIARNIRTPINQKTFGAIQIILLGDFAQLPPVSKTNNITYCFQKPIWKKLKLTIINLTQVQRQSDETFLKTLSNIRLAMLTKDDINLLKSRVVSPPSDSEIKPTKLLSLRADVAQINDNELRALIKFRKEQNLPTKPYKFKSKVQIEKPTSSKPLSIPQQNFYKAMIDSACPAEDELVLVTGAQVMLIKNSSSDKTLVNGSRGIIIGLDEVGFSI
jgi:ATP-dependent DNA helicase PIF1